MFLIALYSGRNRNKYSFNVICKRKDKGFFFFGEWKDKGWLNVNGRILKNIMNSDVIENNIYIVK